MFAEPNCTLCSIHPRFCWRWTAFICAAGRRVDVSRRCGSSPQPSTWRQKVWLLSVGFVPTATWNQFRIRMRSALQTTRENGRSVRVKRPLQNTFLDVLSLDAECLLWSGSLVLGFSILFFFKGKKGGHAFNFLQFRQCEMSEPKAMRLTALLQSQGK